jgi:uncharacterized membrane protein
LFSILKKETMNGAHFHILVNHFPIIGVIFGLLILIGGFILKNNTIKNTAYCLFVVSAVFGFLSMYSGEGAEELVEDIPTVGHQIIHEHEELAEKFVLVLYVTGLFSILAFITSLKNSKFAKLLSLITLLLSIVTTVLSVNVGLSGGEVRHTEIRENPIPLQDTLEGNE